MEDITDELMQPMFNNSRRTKSNFEFSQLNKIKTDLAEKAKILKASPSSKFKPR
jgi:hypothetical protein